MDNHFRDLANRLFKSSSDGLTELEQKVIRHRITARADTIIDEAIKSQRFVTGGVETNPKAIGPTLDKRTF